MPEGDSIARIALRVRSTLLGARVEAVHGSRVARWARVLQNAVLEDVHTHGKWLFLRLSSGWTLATHLGMRGRVDIVASHADSGASAMYLLWIDPRGQQWTLRCETPREIKVTGHADALALAARLGADILDVNLSIHQIVAVMRSAAAPIGDVLLQQNIVSGIGNIYRCEALFVGSIDPTRLTDELPERDVHACLLWTQKTMRRNLGPGRRRTRWGSGPSHWVYGRDGERCLRCDARVQSELTGAYDRRLYWCPGCQSK